VPGGGAGGFDFSGFDLADALRAFMRDFGDEGGGGFGDFFGGGRGGQRRGDDLQVRLRLTLEEIANGVEKRIRVRHLRRCGTCEGKGGSGESQCPQCKGRGRVRRVQQSLLGQFVNIAVCPQCSGEGTIVQKPCETCHGDGRVSETETISVNVPKGVAEGNFIPLRGMGDAGVRNSPPGDLIVLIEEAEHALFQRHGDDLLLEVAIGYPTAVQGGKIDVPTLDGKAATLDVPAGTNSGQALRVRGRGLPGLRGGRGDLIARVIIWVPGKVGGNEKKILEEMKKSGAFTPPPPDEQRRRNTRDAVAG
jgi:molecular chaperone DnaJ